MAAVVVLCKTIFYRCEAISYYTINYYYCCLPLLMMVDWCWYIAAAATSYTVYNYCIVC